MRTKMIPFFGFLFSFFLVFFILSFGVFTQNTYATDCQEWTATNDAHVAAGRAYFEEGGYCDSDAYYAVGSDEDLGSSGSTTTTLYTNDGVAYFVGSCPTSGDDDTVTNDIFNGTYSIVAIHSGKAMDVWEWGTTDGTNIAQYNYWGGDCQKFNVTQVDGIWHRITPVISTGQGVEVADGSIEPLANVQTYNYWGHSCQQWRFQNAGSGRWRIINRNSELCMDVLEWSTDDGANIIQYTCLSGAENQMFAMEEQSSSGGITGASCTSTGTTYVYETIVVSSGTYDGGCRTFVPVGMGDGSQDEDQDPVFRVENGATLKNVIIGSPGVDGIHLYNGATLDNITWTDVGEDACTVKSSGTYYVRNIEGYDGSDKFFQINAACTLNVSNAIIKNMGKALRQNGGTTFKIDVTFDNCDISDMSEGVFRSDSSSSTARITNSRLHNAGDICIGNWASCTYSGITYY